MLYKLFLAVITDSQNNKIILLLLARFSFILKLLSLGVNSLIIETLESLKTIVNPQISSTVYFVYYILLKCRGITLANS